MANDRSTTEERQEQQEARYWLTDAGYAALEQAQQRDQDADQ